MRREVRIELGENKGDKYGDKWETRRIRVQKHLGRTTAMRREVKKALGTIIGRKKQ